MGEVMSLGVKTVARVAKDVLGDGLLTLETLGLYLKQDYILDFTSIFTESMVNIGERYIYLKGAVSLLCTLINIPMGFGVFLAHQSQKRCT